ncbi:transporter substrate-binding domain-containing protein [Treponema primitia]|uniref:transporter substrate-binding domain-containing protein n=1 Tax=Treponema primitia TaxID=88058 RepID=UPI0002555825|nr:transporter substrate-binding domain-containing protein [Treponema primitia]
MKKLLGILLILKAASAVFAAGSGEIPVSDHDIPAVHKIHGKGIVSIGVAEANEPFSFIDAKGKYQGYDIYFARRVAKELFGSERAVYFVPVTGTNWVELLETNKLDMVIAGFAVTEENRELVDFALPYRKTTPGGEFVVAPAVRKGNDGLVYWLNDVIRSRVGDNFFHKDYNATLRPVYGDGVDPEILVIEQGAAL